ncbi:MAG: hypothetical protein ACLP9L_34100 [Thermoguttaceae bacterium]
MAKANETKPRESLLITSEMRLSLRQWAMVVAIVTLIAVATPRLWRHIERFDTGADYRIPYELSNDYWLFDWRLQKTTEAKPIVVLGDSVVWGEYVKSDGTLPHFLNQQAGQPDRFVNAGVNGLFPLALEGLVRCYGTSLHDRKMVVVCNLLWLSSPKADMQADKAETINHASLVPQLFPRIPCYQADANERLSAVIERNIGFMGWVNHLQDAYFHQQSILQWTLDEDPGRQRCYTNVYKSPLAQITLAVPSGQGDDADRGPGSRRHKPWTAGDSRKTAFEWVDLKSSLQWAAFRRTVELLRSRGNDVLVIVAPFNEHMIADPCLNKYREIQAGILTWLDGNRIPHVVPDTLPSELYADASHPLTAGYELMARRIGQADSFRKWIRPF